MSFSMNETEFIAAVENLNKTACDMDLDYEDFIIFGDAVGSDHWLAMNLMWLVEKYTQKTLDPAAVDNAIRMEMLG